MVDEGRGSLNGLQRPLLESSSRRSRGASQKNVSREELSFDHTHSEVPEVLIYPSRGNEDHLQHAFMDKLAQNKNE